MKDMGDLILYQLIFSVLLFWSPCYSLPDRENDKEIPDHVELKPPSNLTTVYVGDGDIYFYWTPPQNYPTHKPENLSVNDEYKINVKDNVHFSDSGTWFEKGSKADQDVNWAFKFYSLPVFNSKSLDTEESNAQNSQDLPSETNKTFEEHLKEHIIQANFTSEQLDKIVQHYKSKKVSELPEWFKKTTVPKEHAGILLYTIIWQEMENGTLGEVWNDTVKPSKLDYHIKGLKALTDYRICVEVVYYSFTTLRSECLEIKTNRNFSLIRTEDHKDICNCYKMGTVNDTPECKVHHFGSLILNMCQCKEEYSGMYCHICRPGYYRLGPNMPCYQCPCDHKKSNGHCHFREGYLFCDTCHEGYRGNLCQSCAEGYYRPGDSTYCTKCNCHGNTNLCQDITGECIGCRYNTAGFNCNRCAHGYVNMKKTPHETSCVPAAIASQMQEKDKSSVSSGAIAGICVTVIVVIGLVIGVVIYKRYWRYPTARPFWTVELKDDHEGISFSSVPEDELVAITAREEEALQEKRRGKSGSQPYAKLRENI